MKLKYKFSLPSIFQAIIITCLIIFLAIQGNKLLSNLKIKSASINSATDAVHSIAGNSDRFFLDEIDQAEFESELNQTISGMKNQTAFDASGLIEEIDAINELIKSASTLQDENRSIITKILELTELSISQSTGYINQTAANLADPQKRNQVSALERMVIIGASINNDSNLRIQTLAFQMLKDFSIKDKLLSFLDQGIVNAQNDAQKLEGTPYKGMAVAAVNANKSIKDLTLTYIKNVEEVNKLRQSIASIEEEMLNKLKDISESNIDTTFDDIYGLGLFLFSTLILISVIIVGLGLFFTRMVTLPLLNLRNLVTSVVDNGDFSQRMTITQKDEVGETATAFNGLMGSLEETISEVNSVMEAVADGDFTLEVKSEQRGDMDRLKKSINRSVEMLGNTIAQVDSASEQVDTGTKQLTQSAQALASGATEQAASLEEISSTTSIIDSQTRANSENAEQARQITNQTLTIVKNGNQKMSEMLASMKEINDTSSNVSKVIKVIDEIAFQTNLLALNAAVEAARAGKYGKGFAVVAEEVRNLAGRSAEAAKSTTELIETSIKEVERGVSNSDQTAAALAEITNTVEKINDLVGEITEASREQTTGIDEINRGLTQINQVVQHNSSISEETASSSDELSAQATELRKLIGKFKLKNRAAQTIEYIEGSQEDTFYLE
jgi:methyl-accepting chemotaxis protein